MFVSILEYIIKIAEVMTAFGVIAAILIKPFRLWITGAKEKKIREERYDEAIRCLLRDAIKNFYNSRVEEAKIKQYEYENIEKMYKAYKALKGNSFVDKLWSEICCWTIDS